MTDAAPARSRPTTVVLSPHLDDAAFSASVEVAAGATVVSVFCGDPGPAVHGAWDRICGFASSSQAIAARLAEDDVALGLLGGTSGTRLGLLDDQYLDGPRPVDEVRDALAGVEVLAGVRVGDLDGGGAGDLHGAPEGDPECDPSGGRHGTGSDAPAPAPAVARDEPVTVLAPAGIGGHPDHLVVRDAATRLCRERGWSLRLYADLPYAVQFGWPPSISGAPAPTWDASVAWSLLLPEEARPVEDHPALTDAQIAAKLHALRAYASQWGPINALGQLDDPALWRFEPRWTIG